jgi:hypothetical protein
MRSCCREQPSGRCSGAARSPCPREVYSEDQVVSNEGYRVSPPSMNSVWPVM